jgi:hypothetical protein
MTELDTTRFFFHRQPAHMLAGLLIAAIAWFSIDGEALSGEALGISTQAWLVIGFAIGMAHQVYVWVLWRGELCWSIVTRQLGSERGFLLYRIGFFILILSRLVPAFALAYADFGSWYAPNYLTNIVALLIFLPVGYTLFCVGKYFGFARASGADHFDPEYRTKPFVRKGIFKYIPNAMYALALLLFFVFAVATGSKAMLALAAFYYVFIWVHYFCTERPDMEVIYGGHLEQIRAGIDEKV